MVDLHYVKDKSVRVGASLQRIEQRCAGSCVRRTGEAGSGSCNQATEPRLTKVFSQSVNVSKSVRFGNIIRNTQSQMKPILAVVTAAIHRYMKSWHR